MIYAKIPHLFKDLDAKIKAAVATASSSVEDVVRGGGTACQVLRFAAWSGATKARLCCACKYFRL